MVSLAPGQRAAAQISGPRPVIALTVDHLVDEPLNGFLILAMTHAAWARQSRIVWPGCRGRLQLCYAWAGSGVLQPMQQHRRGLVYAPCQSHAPRNIGAVVIAVRSVWDLRGAALSSRRRFRLSGPLEDRAIHPASWVSGWPSRRNDSTEIRRDEPSLRDSTVPALINS